MKKIPRTVKIILIDHQDNEETTGEVAKWTTKYNVFGLQTNNILVVNFINETKALKVLVIDDFDFRMLKKIGNLFELKSTVHTVIIRDSPRRPGSLYYSLLIYF